MSTVRLFKNAGKNVAYWEIDVTDVGELRISHAKSLDGKATTTLRQCEGKNIGRANETTPFEQATLEMESRIRKQIDKGYQYTMDAAAAPVVNSLGFEKPVLAVVYSKVKQEAIDWENAYAQRKFDGHRCMYKNGQLYSRGSKPINLPHILAAIQELGMGDLHLDGELYVHGVVLQNIGSLVSKPREESLVLQYHVYDIVDQDKSFSERFIQCPMLSGNDVIKIVDTVKVTDQEALFAFNELSVSLGYEGSMLRHGLQGYQTGKRSTGILKLKAYLDTEGKVTGYRSGTAVTDADGRLWQHIIWVVANPFKPGTYVDMVRVGSREERQAEFDTAESFVGKTLTFKYFALSEDMIPMQAVGLAWKEVE